MNNGESSYRRYLEGDDNAFEDVVRLYLDSLVFFIERYVHDIHAAEDIAMEAFAYLIIHPKRYNFKTSLKTYLFMIGRSRAINYVKRRNKIQFTSLTGIESEDFSSLEEAVIADEARRSLSRAIEELPDDMKAAVHLVYFEGQSYEEASRVLKKTKKQIANLLSRAKVLLKEKLGERGKLI
ncbi:MAG: RNA polymerase sigma factor [Clostridia bacterium]|nr:RNA polymerase sigma factor [Clostridia bacterium]